MRGIWAAPFLIWTASIALAANSITGAVRNQSRGASAVGDEVILIRIQGRPHEEARTKTDQSGAFLFNVQHPDEPYLVRVLHENVDYDEHANAGNKLVVQVFDASPRVIGVAGTIEILRVETRGNLLHVSDLCEVVNSSNPPLTLAGDRTFDVYLPANALIDSVVAAGPDKTAAMISATRLSDELGHYSVNFPLRPGATKFAFNYKLPYNGRAAFRTRHAYPLQQFAVMIPREMKFASSPSLETLATGNGIYEVRAANQLKPGEGPAFEISGSGALPAIRNEPATQVHAQLDAAQNSGIRNLTSSVNHDPSSLPQINPQLASTASVPPFVWTGVTGVLLLLCVLVVARFRRRRDVAAPKTHNERSVQPTSAFLRGLREELLQLEADRKQGTISAQEYASAKHAIDETLNRAVARSHAR